VTAKKSAKLRPDVAETAYRVMMEATGQLPKTDPANREKNPEAVARGRAGGLKGGPARAAKIGPKKARRIAKLGGKARWADP
jgi:hypothetical protein